MEKEEWDRMGRQDREELLISLGVNKGVAERNAKSNFAFLDEGVKRTVGNLLKKGEDRGAKTLEEVPYECQFYQKNIDEIDRLLTQGPKRVDINWVEDTGARIRVKNIELMFVPWEARQCVKFIKTHFEELGYTVSTYGY